MRHQFPDGYDPFNLRRTDEEKNAADTSIFPSEEDIWYILRRMQRKIGKNRATDPDSLDYRISQLEAAASASTPETASSTEVANETPAGAINGSNTTFTTAEVYLERSTKVYLNGVRMTLGADYTEGVGHTIEFVQAPTAGDTLRVDYLKS